MNIWKTIAIVSTSALVAVVGQQVASANYAGSTGASVNADYRQMHAALENLREARHHFENSEHNHGGWRERALESTDRAIHETEGALNWNP
ncbi:MAG TPA: hypothetical protein VH044_05140 [Polyangiaceae bacterium]|jgi:hypothetical protein|nr:hypothetical protein [Polyangiaceae bacterium]